MEDEWTKDDELAAMTMLAREGWAYADDYFQEKWLPKKLLREWFPNNRYLNPPLG